MFKIHLKTTKKSVTTTIQMKDEMAQLKKMNNAYILTIKEHQLDLDILWKEKITMDLSLLSSDNVFSLNRNILCNLTEVVDFIGLSLDEPNGLGGREGREES